MENAKTMTILISFCNMFDMFDLIYHRATKNLGPLKKIHRHNTAVKLVGIGTYYMGTIQYDDRHRQFMFTD